MSDKPTVLILSGTEEGYARALLAYLVPPPPVEPLAAHVRLVDKFLCVPKNDTYLTYMDKESRRALNSSNVEYLQANLLADEGRRRAFILPDAYGGLSKAYDHVYDFTSERMHDVAEKVHIERSAKTIPQLGQIAAAQGVKAYVRQIPTTYKSENKKPMKDGEGVTFDVRGKWIHEGVRALAAIPNLNLVVIRPALLYGPYMTSGYAPRLLIGEIYKYLGEPMEHLWSADLSVHTVHSHDFSSAAFDLARWMAPLGREAANKQAGETISTSLSSSDPLPEGFPGKKEKFTVPAFNIVDVGETTQGKMADITGKVINIKTGFYGTVINQFAKLNFTDVVEDANEKHLEPWPEILANSNPPILNTPLTPYIPAPLLSKNHIAFDGTKLGRTISWKPAHPKMTEESVRDQLEKFRTEGIWPNAPPKK